jgi:hypothetical protein
MGDMMHKSRYQEEWWQATAGGIALGGMIQLIAALILIGLCAVTGNVLLGFALSWASAVAGLHLWIPCPQEWEE